MESICPICKKPYDGVVCTQCTVTDLDVSGLMASEGLQVESAETSEDTATAFLVDLVSNRKIPITTPRCKVGRDDLNDIVISGDQSISRFHFVISKENNEYLVQDGKSRHGTFLNGNQISAPEPIHDGDVLKVGVSLFWFVIESAVNAVDAPKTPSVTKEVGVAQELEFMVPDSDQSAVKMKGDDLQPDTESTMAIPKVTAADIAASVEQQTKDIDKAESAKDSKSDSKSDNGKGSANASSKNGKGKNDKKSDSSKTDKGKDFEGETFSADPNSPEQNQSTLLNAISDSIQGSTQGASVTDSNKDNKAGKGKDQKNGPKLDKLRRFDPESLMNQDENFELGSFTFFEPLTAKPEDSELSPSDLAKAEEVASKAEGVSVDTDTAPEVSMNATATSEFIPYVDSDDASNDGTEIIAAASQSEEDASSKTDTIQASNGDAPQATDGTDTISANTESAVEDATNAVGDGSSEDADKTTSTEITGEAKAEDVVAETPISDEKSDNFDNPDNSEIEGKSSDTLDKFAEIVGEASSAADSKKADEERSDMENLAKVIGDIQTTSTDQVSTEDKGADLQAIKEEKHSNGAKSAMSTVIESSGVVPNWCKKYFSSELGDLGKQLAELNEQVKAAQQKIQDVEGRVALTKGLRNVLLSSQGEDLVNGCGKVLGLLGWDVKVSDDDKHELRLNTDEKDVCIASIVWTNTQADRTHLAQLSISQTRFWCEQGTEPKGILIVSKASDSEPEQLGAADFNSELADYAKKKNVCLMTTLQLLSIYKEVALAKGNAEKVRQKMTESSGWLEGFNLEPGELLEESEETTEAKDESSTNKLSSLLSA